MNYLFILATLTLLSSVKALFLPKKVNFELDSHWETFKTVYKKQYEEQSETIRRLIWESNLDFIQRHNLQYDLGKKSYTLGMNEYGDLTREEFKEFFLSSNMDLDNDTSSTFMPPLNVNSYPDTVDWRSQGYVTEVKQQDKCGSCWSFAAAGALEGQYFRKTGALLNFSEQQLMDCSWGYYNHGCKSGQMNRAYQYIKDYGIELEDDYPYTARDNQCEYETTKVITNIAEIVKIRRFNERDLLEATASVGPISVAVDASRDTFRFYSGGVYDEPSCSAWQLNHGMLVVGYGTRSSKPHWIVKNSWGKSWGEDGYIFMSRNKGNQCGIATLASFPSL